MALSIGTLVGYLSLDDSNFNRKADTADRKINALKLHLEALSRTNPNIKVQVDAETAKLDELQARIKALKVEAAKGVDVKVEMTQAMIALDAVQAKLRSLHNEEVKVKVDVDDAVAVAKVESLKAQLDSLNLWNPGPLTTAIAGIGPAILPVLTAAAGGIAALGTGAVSAAGGIGVLKLAYHGLGAEVQAYTKYQTDLANATTKAQRLSAAHTLATSAYGTASGREQSMARFLVNKVNPAGERLQSTAQRAVFPGTEKALRTLITDLPIADRLVSRFGHTMGQMEVDAAHALTNPFWTHFFNQLGKDAQTDLPLIGHIFGNTFEGIARTIERFSPQGTSLLTWIDGLTKKFDDWTQGGKGSSFEKFMQAVPKDAHAFMAVLKAAAPVVGNLLKGLNSVGVGELHVLAGGLSLLAKIPAGPLRALGAALPLIVLGMKGIALTRGAASAIAGLSKLGRLGRLGRLGGTVAGEVGGVALGKGVVPVYVTNSGFGGLPGEGKPGVGVGKFGVPLISTLGTIGAVGGLVGGGLAAENALINHLQRFKPSTLNVPYAPNINAPQGAYQHEMSASAIKAAQMNVNPDDLKRYNDQLTKLIALDRKLYPAANSAQAGVEALGKGFEQLIQVDPAKAMSSLLKTSDVTGISIKHLAQVVPGLGAAMKAAGIPVTELGVKLHSLPSKVQTAITTPGAIQSYADIKKLANQYDLTPKQIRTLVQLAGTATAAAQIRAYSNQLAALNGRVATTYLRQVTQHVIAGGGHPVLAKGSADGSMVPKGGPYRDRYLYALAPGEEVISNRNGEADHFRALRDAGMIPGLASGGTAKKHHLTPAQRRRRALQARMHGAHGAVAHTQNLIGNASDFAQAFAGNVFGADLPTTKDVTVPGKTFTTVINGQTVTESTPSTTKTVDLSSKQILAEMLKYQHGQASQAHQLLTDVKRLSREGVSKSLLAQMQASGPQGVAEIHALASGSRAQVQQFNRLNSQTTKSLQQAGGYAAAGTSMTALQNRKANEEATVRAIKRGLHGVKVEIKHTHLRVN